MSQTFAHCAKKVGAARTVCNGGADIFIQSMRKIGLLLGPPPGKGKGAVGRYMSDNISHDQAKQCRAAAHKVPDDVYERYLLWLQHHSEDHLTFRVHWGATNTASEDSE